MGRAPTYDKNNPADSLTGGQIQEILDYVILEALTPIILTSDVFDIQLIYLLSLTTRNRKRKISALPREEFISLVSQALIIDDRSKKIELIAKAKIERSFLYNFVVNFLKETEGYRDLYQRYLVADRHEHASLNLRLNAIEANVGASRDRLFPAINTCTDYLELTYEFRNSIVSNYVKFAYKQAMNFCDMKGPNYDFKDVFQNFLTAITKAVDKYDCSKGALTSYIQFWLLNAQTADSSHGHEYGIAYTLPQLQKKNLACNTGGGEVNFSVSMDKLTGKDNEESGGLQDYIVGSEGVDREVELKQELDLVRYFAKCADIRGLARLYLEIDEVFSTKELVKMAQTMQKQGLELPREANVVMEKQQRRVELMTPKPKTTSVRGKDAVPA